MNYLLGLFLVLVAAHTAGAQKRVVVLKSTRNQLTIREGNFLYKDVWGVSSQTRPDVFVANRFKGRQRIVFYSDTDSAVFVVKPQKTYDFIVLLNNRDSAYTQISTYAGKPASLAPKLVFTKPGSNQSGPDTIAFRLDKNFGIHIRGKVNDSDSLDFLFDTGAGAVIITAALVNQKVKLKLDGRTVNTGIDGSQSVSTSSGNKLEVGGLTWRNVSFLAIDYQGSTFDGVLSWVAFENRVVEIDYEQRYLVIHRKLGNLGPEYSKLDLKMMGGIPYIKCLLTANGRQSEGWFDLDTGSDGGLAVSQRFAAGNGLTSGLKQIGTSASRGSAGGVVRQNIFLLPKLKLGDYELYRLPLFVNEQDPEGGATAENVGSSILKRFNLILDFPANRAYLKPNKYLYTPVLANPTP